MDSGNRFQKILIAAASRLTDWRPRAGARILNRLIPPIAGSPLLSAAFARHNRKVMRGVRSFRRFLVIPDIHIGDAIMTQSVLVALRDFFPDAQVDYLVNRIAFPIIDGLPDATRVLPFFEGGSLPTRRVLSDLLEMVRDGRYDLCLNSSPFVRNKDIARKIQPIINFTSDAPTLIFNERHPQRANHFFIRMYSFVRDQLALAARPARPPSICGARLILADAAVERARRFAAETGLTGRQPWIFLNPDAASRFCRIPFDRQVDLISRLARGSFHLLIGAGQTEAGIGERLKAALPPEQGREAIIVPASFPLDAYAALIDSCDVFISGDTGPLHVAAARKYSRTGRFKFRNRTAVLSVFGATPARMSGYDSFQAGFLAANQDAPSWTYNSPSPCRNITCLDKIYKTCRTVRCFEGFDARLLAERIRTYLETADSRRGIPSPA